MKSITFIFTLFFVLTGARLSQASSAGAKPFNFLFLDANARAVGMGGAYTALATDVNALLYNPAGLGRVRRHEATFMHNQYFEGITQDYLAYASPLGWSANINYLSFGDVARTTLSNPDGRDLGSTGLSDLAFGTGYGRALNEDLTVGVGAKYIRESIAGISAHGFALDLGVLYAVRALERFTVGLAVQNIGPSVKFQSDKENLPLNLRIGAVYDFSIGKNPFLNMGGHEYTISFDVTKQRSEEALIAVGIETLVAKMMPVRVGFNTRNDAGTGVTVGLGWTSRVLALDYAFVPFGDLGSTHRISATWRWGAGQEASWSGTKSKPHGRHRIKTTPETPEDHFMIADALIDKRGFKEAKNKLRAAYRMFEGKDQRRVRYHERLGHIAYLKKDISKAKNHFMQALELASVLGFTGSDVADSYLGMGLCLIEEQDLRTAEQYLYAALKTRPSPETRHRAKGELNKLMVSKG